MNGCTPTDKPLISILMAVYEPRMDWLKEQLDSLNNQTYPNLQLYIRDDCSPTVSYEDICECVKKCIIAFPYSINRNETNLGSNRTFELLTQEADGDYYAYCDQDDVWLPEKLNVLLEAIERESAQLVCSDMFIIDGNGRQIADSITKIRRHHVFKSGVELAPSLLFSNFITGCTMLMRAGTTKQAIPFCPYMFHDHWLALFSAYSGKIISLNLPLINYRIHDRNQTQMLAGVYDRESYISLRIDKSLKKLLWLKENFNCSSEFKKMIEHGIIWMKSRELNLRGYRGQKKTIWKYRCFSPNTSLFEIFAPFLPDVLFMFIIKLKRENVL